MHLASSCVALDDAKPLVFLHFLLKVVKRDRERDREVRPVSRALIEARGRENFSYLDLGLCFSSLDVLRKKIKRKGRWTDLGCFEKLRVVELGACLLVRLWQSERKTEGGRKLFALLTLFLLLRGVAQGLRKLQGLQGYPFNL